jgi:hypothetical protein
MPQPTPEQRRFLNALDELNGAIADHQYAMKRGSLRGTSAAQQAGLAWLRSLKTKLRPSNTTLINRILTVGAHTLRDEAMRQARAQDAATFSAAKQALQEAIESGKQNLRTIRDKERRVDMRASIARYQRLLTAIRSDDGDILLQLIDLGPYNVIGRYERFIAQRDKHGGQHPPGSY